ncbi:unannotated protein [freshwater metagenome]|uniref:Unannotated protein n=1 Tax=freshwater metagenome TaxID=449393 RepID=A0A6J6H0D8_9ZZZZ|nr:hypothetical protein [Actinomycetota bacterium]
MKLRYVFSIGLVLLSACGQGSDKSSVTTSAPTTIADNGPVLPTEQIFSLVDAYVASAIQSRPKIMTSTNAEDLKSCARRSATDLGNSVLQSFTSQSPAVNTHQNELAHTAVMQSIQQNLERFIAQCSTK